MSSLFNSPKTYGTHRVWCKYESEQYNSPVSVCLNQQKYYKT